MLFPPSAEDTQKLLGQLRSAIRFLRHSRREATILFIVPIAAGLARLLESAKQPDLLAFLLDAHAWEVLVRSCSLALYGAALAGFAWAVYRLWRQLTPPLGPAPKIAPFAIKGPMAFGEHDGALFRRLGRGEDIARLLGWILDPQIALVVVMGESGAGKTSLLRAGLYDVLKEEDPPIACHYWEAVPDKPLAGLLAAIRAGWPDAVKEPAPQKLTDLYSLGGSGSRHVVILDQFEQLSPHEKSHHSLFQLLKKMAKEVMPPHRTTFVVAFRRDYDPIWRDFELDALADHRLTMMSLRLFSEDQAKDIIAVIADAAGFTLDNALVDDLIASMQREDARISPVDIGITLLALSERALGKPDKHLSRGDYRIAGGATGLLAEYVLGQLERYPADERNAILKMLLELADLKTDQRLAKGLEPEQLAEKLGVPAVILRRYLSNLASPRVRLLEELPAGGYRLPHERLIPPLRQIGGVMLAEADLAGRDFNLAYQAWVAGHRSRALLLGGRRLRRTLRYRSQLHLGTDRLEKEQFLARSLQWHRWQRVIASTLAAFALICGYLVWEYDTTRQYKANLADWRLPAALYEQPPSLKSLAITNDRLTHLRWSHGGLSKLSLSVSSANSLEGLEGYENLTTLTLDLKGSEVTDLSPLKHLAGLTTLTLDLGDSRVTDLAPLKDLAGLTTLTLDLWYNGVPDLAPLKDFGGLTKLTVNLGSNRASDLAPLKDLAGLTTVTLAPESSGVPDFAPLKDLAALTTLTLDMDLGSSGVLDLAPLKDLAGLNKLTVILRSRRTIDLAPLKGFAGLTTLTLDVGLSGMTDLVPLKDLAGLTTLELFLGSGGVPDLAPLKDLAGLTTLTLGLGPGGVPDLAPLKDLVSLTTLTLDIGFNDAPDLTPLKDLAGLTTLTLDLRSSGVPDLTPLKDLAGLTTLTLVLGSSGVPDFAPLKNLTGLATLTLDLGGPSGMTDLAPLKDLAGLTTLALYLGSSGVTDLTPLKDLAGLTTLELFLGSSSVPDLAPLKDLTGLTTLTLGLGPGGVPDLAPLKDLAGVTTLTLDLIGSGMRELRFLSSLTTLDALTIRHDGLYELGTMPRSLTKLTLSDRR